MDYTSLISNLIKTGEGKRLVFLSQLRMDTVAKNVCGLINEEGGDLLLGISSDGEIVGLKGATAKVDELSGYLNKHVQPNAPISVSLVKYKKHDLIWISVWEGAQKPYSFQGKIYARTQEDTSKANNEDLSSFILQRKASEFHWERQSLLGLEEDGLSIRQVEDSILLFERKNPHLRFSNDPIEFLQYMGLYQNGHFTNAAAILYAKNPVRYLPQAKVRLTVYADEKSSDSFLYDRLYESNLFQNIQDVFDYIDVLFGRSSYISGLKRTERQKYPIVAVREGIMNALVHRDYSKVSSTVHISIYSNRMVISNTGILPEGLHIADLKREHTSILRNPDIARMCFVHDLIEMLGSGTQRMVKDCKTYGLTDPIWKEDGDHLILEFLGLGIGEGVGEGVSEGVNDVVIEGVNDGVNDSLNRLITLINTTPGMNAKQLAIAIGKGHSTVERYLKLLRENMLIEFRGAPKDGGYFVLDK
ncbi:ATP-binding protein [Sphingobacterium faecium]|uniref:ATP-binding protein n=1 Tax=Sphingobacterium faecium TaxID=34087 RepID=UPI003208422F